MASEECIRAFQWDGTPAGQETTLADHPTYVTGSNKDAAVLIVHDIYGWTFSNIRLLADAYANEANVTVYLPDFFGGEVIPPGSFSKPPEERNFDLPGFMARNGKEAREPEIVACAQTLRAQYKKVGTIGFCYGGWAVFRLGAKGRQLVDCISTAHPSRLTEEEIQNVGVPVQILSPENDSAYTPELKAFSNKVIPTLGVPYDYSFFPGLVHGFAVKGDPKSEVEMKGLVRAKNAAVYWFKQWLHEN